MITEHQYFTWKRDFDNYLKQHPEVWQSLADKLWGNFVDYKDEFICIDELLNQENPMKSVKTKPLPTKTVFGKQ